MAANAQRSYEIALRELDLTAQHVGALTLLAAEPQKQARLSEQLGVFSAHTVRVVDALEARGLVDRVPHPTDGRAVLVRVTVKGRRVLRLASHISDRVTADVFAPLSADERALLDAALRRLAGTEEVG